LSAEPAYDDDALQALIRAYVACRVAIDALPALPDDVRIAVEGAVTTFCRVVEPELERVGRRDLFTRAANPDETA
jgi:hypothetical protein